MNNKETVVRDLTPEEAYTWLAKIMPGCHNDELEKIIATDAYWACEYAVNVIKGRFELAEQVIAKNPIWSYYYARYAIKGRFKLGEPAINRSEFCVKYFSEFLM